MYAHVLKDMQEDKILVGLIVAVITLEFLVCLLVLRLSLYVDLECARNYKKSADIYISAVG